MSKQHRHGIESSVAIFGHPVHPMIVPFPIAAFVGALAADLAWRTTGDAFWPEAAIWLLMTGVATGLLAGLVGAVDYATIRRVRSLASGQLHAIGNVVALVLGVANLGLRAGDGADDADLPFYVSLATVAILFVTAWLGGELSYRHRIGVMETRDGEDDVSGAPLP